MQAIFEHKPDFRLRDFVIEKTVKLPTEQFEKMLRSPMDHADSLKENASLMRQDSMGVYHCLLVTGDGRSDGILVDSEGSNYARYASYVPEATALRYPSLLKRNRELTTAVDFIIADGTGQSKEGNWILTFDELKKKTGLCVEGNPYLQELLEDMLLERSEVASLVIKDGCFRVYDSLNDCPSVQQEMTPRQTLRELIQTPMEDIHLLHKDVEIQPATIVELSYATLTEAGEQAWADVLDANVYDVYWGAYGLQAELDGVKPSRLQDFSAMLAGYCSQENYEKWVNEAVDGPVSPQLKNT